MSATFTCPKCNLTFYTKPNKTQTGCLVMHPVAQCCHYSHTEVTGQLATDKQQGDDLLKTAPAPLQDHIDKELLEFLFNTNLYPAQLDYKPAIKALREFVHHRERIAVQDFVNKLPRFTDVPNGSKVPISLVAWHDVEDLKAELNKEEHEQLVWPQMPLPVSL